MHRGGAGRGPLRTDPHPPHRRKPALFPDPAGRDCEGPGPGAGNAPVRGPGGERARHRQAPPVAGGAHQRGRLPEKRPRHQSPPPGRQAQRRPGAGASGLRRPLDQGLRGQGRPAGLHEQEMAGAGGRGGGNHLPRHARRRHGEPEPEPRPALPHLFRGAGQRRRHRHRPRPAHLLRRAGLHHRGRPERARRGRILGDRKAQRPGGGLPHRADLPEPFGRGERRLRPQIPGGGAAGPGRGRPCPASRPAGAR